MKAIKTKEEIAMNEFGLKDGANCPELWAGGSWQQWPLQPSMFQNIPHEQIDWAALAQQWIQMRETTGGPSNSNDQPPMMGGTVHAPPRPVDGNKPMKHENTDDGSNSQESGSFRQGDWNYWNVNTPPPPPPPPAWNASVHTNEAKESLAPYEFGQAHGNQGFAAQSYDYNHGSDQYGYNQVYVEQNQLSQYWAGGQPNAVFPRKEHRLQVAEREGIAPPRDDEDLIALPPSLDAAKRKQLPAWIREGLEKMEREKQKRLEKERLLREREEQLRSMKEAEERAMKEFLEARGDSLIPRKSKFDSDSEEEEEEAEDLAKSPSPVKVREYSSVEEEDDEAKSDEEKLADLMMRVRQLLTEILLEVTNEEVTQIAKEVLNRAKAKAPAMQLASSSALASITRGLGLGVYGTDDSEESGGEDDDAIDSDVDLQVSINRRKKEFCEKEKEIVAGLKSDESDLEPDNESKQACDFLQPSPEREKYHFEKKYSEIPGLDVAASLPDENFTGTGNDHTSPEEIALAKDAETKKESAEKSAPLHPSSDSDSEKDSGTSSSSTGREKSQRRDRDRDRDRDRNRNRSPSRDRDRDRNRDRDRRRRSRSRSRDRRRSRSGSRNRRSRNLNRDRSNSRDRNRRAACRRKERSRRSRSRSSSRRQRRDRGRRTSRSYSRSRSRSPRKHSRRGRGRESRSPSGEGSGKKSSRKQTT